MSVSPVDKPVYTCRALPLSARQAMIPLLVLVMMLAASQQPSVPPLAEIAALQAKAEKGDAAAQRMLGEKYEHGDGVPQNAEKAAEWYRKAGLQGDGVAALNLGVLYWTGDGVPQDRQEATQWYRRAARQKNATAMFNLAVAYYDGEGVTADRTWAYAWFCLAQEGGNTQAADGVKRLESEMHPSERADAWVSIASMYEHGFTLKDDLSEAARWYRRAAAGGNPSAAVHLASILVGGRLGPPDYAEALRWCEAAAAQNYDLGLYCVGHAYQWGWVGPKDMAAAAPWFLRAAQAGSADAAAQLAEMYWNGDGVKADRVTAYMYALLASATDSGKKDADRFRVALTEKEVRKAEQRAREFLVSSHALVLKKLY